MPSLSNLICPLDGADLEKHSKLYTCPNGHSFDIARQGYINLLPAQYKRSKNPGDSKEMVLARKQFLNAGFYQPVADKILSVIKNYYQNKKPLSILDAGCGEGYYLNYIASSILNDINEHRLFGLDISKEAILEAAKQNKNITWVVGTNRQPPLTERSIDVILCVFGFQSFEGFKKIIDKNGVVIIIEPGDSHLQELRDLIYNDKKVKNSHDSSIAIKNDFQETETESLNFKIVVNDQALIKNLLVMTPHFYRANKQGLEKVMALNSIELTIDVTLRVYKLKL